MKKIAFRASSFDGVISTMDVSGLDIKEVLFNVHTREITLLQHIPRYTAQEVDSMPLWKMKDIIGNELGEDSPVLRQGDRSIYMTFILTL